ncbi:hypothetical protein ACNNMX_02040 [Aerococcus viridans]|uniref:hypothetical protein n=1 Tax=Aerococcus viridans TaxID=1377 RepID=UPI003AA9BC22
MNLQEEILKIKNEMIDEFDKRVEALKEDGQEFPQDGDDYWFIDSTGEVINEKWEGLGFEIERLEFGNIFKTKEQVEFAFEKLKVEAELRKFSQHPNIGAGKWFIVCGDSGNVYTSYTNQGIFQGSIYFESAEKIRQALESVGEDRIKKYIFGVED